MKVNLLAFGIAKEIIGHRFQTWEINPGANVSDLRVMLARQYPLMQNLATLRFAVNNEYATEDLLLQENDEVALIPPVSGG